MRHALCAAALAVLFTSACAPPGPFKRGTELIEAGQIEAGLQKVEEAVRLEPQNGEYRNYLLRARERAVQRFVVQGDTARQQGDPARALAAYRHAGAIDPANPRPRMAIEAMERDQRHQALLTEAEAALNAGRTTEAQARVRLVLDENRQHRGAIELQRRIEEKTVAAREPALDAALRRPVTLEFRDTDLRTVFELLSRSTGINFFFDKDLKPDLRTTVFVRNTSLEDVIRFILVTNQLERKVLNENTLLIYPNTPQKTKEYQELVTKSFYLAHADVKVAANMIRSMVKTRDVFIDEKLRLVVMRDTPDAVRMAEKLIAAQDLAESEVMLDVEVLEVASTLLNELGVRYPDQLSFSIVGAGGTPGNITLPEWLNRSSALYRISVNDPLLTLNLKENLGRTNTLANPRIRVKDGQKARIHIGDRVPVITTTFTATSFASESVSYLDVGLKLEVEPVISLSNEVSLRMGLEVSNIAREIRSAAGALVYQIGTRNANTVLHLRDGETQILAGLISDDERKTADSIPGLGRLPIIGRLFGNERATTTKSEIVLLITPHIVRTIARPDAQATEFMSGTDTAVGAPPLILRPLQPPPGEAGADKAAAPAVVLRGTGAPPPVAGTEAAPAAPGAAPALPPPAPDAPPAARMNAQVPSQARAGERFTVGVDLLADVPLRAGSFELAYDESRLKIVRVDEGDLFRKQGRGSSFNYNIQEDVGRLSVSYSAGNAVKGSENIAKVTFEVIAPTAGAARIMLSNVGGEDPTGRPLAVAAPAPANVTLSR